MAGGSSRARLGAVLAASILILLANFASGSAACGTENSGCARAGPARLWLGRVFTRDGRPATRAVVEYLFDSNRSKGGVSRTPVTASTDSEGRYCLRWPAESSTAFVAVPGGRFVLVSPDASGTPGASYLIGSNGDPNLTVTNRGWQPASDATDACVTRSPPWNRTEDVKSNWRYRVLLYLPLLSIALAVAGAGSRRATEIGRWATRTSGVLAAAAVVFYFLVWVTGSV
jgi:hypothetical protein